MWGMLAARRLALALALSVCAAGAPAAAQPKKMPNAADGGDAAKKQEARTHYKKGLKFHDAKKFDAALTELRASLELFYSPNTELLIGHSLRGLDRKVEAVRAYERCMKNSGAKVRAGEKRYEATLEEAGRWAAVLKNKLAEVTVVVTAPPEGLTLSLNGEALEGEPDDSGVIRIKAYSEPGAITVMEGVPGEPEEERALDVSAGTSERVAFDFTPEVVAPPPPPPPEEEPESKVEIFPPPLPTIIAGGVGVAGIAVFGIFGAMSASTASDLDECSPNCDASLQGDADTASTNQLIANIGLIVGGTALAVGAGYWIYTVVDGDSASDDEYATPDRPKLSVGVGPGQLRLLGSF